MEQEPKENAKSWSDPFKINGFFAAFSNWFYFETSKVWQYETVSNVYQIIISYNNARYDLYCDVFYIRNEWGN